MNVLKGWRFVPQVSAWTSLDLGGCLLSRGAGGSPLSLYHHAAEQDPPYFEQLNGLNHCRISTVIQKLRL